MQIAHRFWWASIVSKKIKIINKEKKKRKGLTYVA
jgi:hypothetical protein